jgi:hypothetical protein
MPVVGFLLCGTKLEEERAIRNARGNIIAHTQVASRVGQFTPGLSRSGFAIARCNDQCSACKLNRPFSSSCCIYSEKSASASTASSARATAGAFPGTESVPSSRLVA